MLKPLLYIVCGILARLISLSSTKMRILRTRHDLAEAKQAFRMRLTSLFDNASIVFHASRPGSWVLGPIFWHAGRVHSSSDGLDPITKILFVSALAAPLSLGTIATARDACCRRETDRISLVAFGVNDVYDFESDMRNPRKTNKYSHGTALDPRHHGLVLRFATLGVVVAFVLAIPAWQFSPEAFMCAMLAIVVAWVYSVPPLRLKDRPVLDSLSNGALCWLVWASGYTFTGARSVVLDRHCPNVNNGYFVFLLTAAVHSFAAAADARADLLAGCRTTATVLGQIPALWISLLYLCVSLPPAASQC